MNQEEKREMLQQVTAVSANLQSDVGFIEHKVLQTDNDIETMEEILDDLRMRKDVVMADDYMAFNIVNAYGDCMTHLSAVVAKLEHKVATLKMALEAVNEVVAEIDFFANRVPGIPTNE